MHIAFGPFKRGGKTELCKMREFESTNFFPVHNSTIFFFFLYSPLPSTEYVSFRCRSLSFFRFSAFVLKLKMHGSTVFFKKQKNKNFRSNPSYFFFFKGVIFQTISISSSWARLPLAATGLFIFIPFHLFVHSPTGLPNRQISSIFTIYTFRSGRLPKINKNSMRINLIQDVTIWISKLELFLKDLYVMAWLSGPESRRANLWHANASSFSFFQYGSFHRSVDNILFELWLCRNSSRQSVFCAKLRFLLVRTHWVQRFISANRLANLSGDRALFIRRDRVIRNRSQISYLSHHVLT